MINILLWIPTIFFALLATLTSYHSVKMGLAMIFGGHFTADFGDEASTIVAVIIHLFIPLPLALMAIMFRALIG